MSFVHKLLSNPHPLFARMTAVLTPWARSLGQSRSLLCLSSESEFILHLSRWCSVAESSPALWPHGLQHTRLHCPSPSPGVCSNSCPLSRWCHRTISSSLVPSSSCLLSFLASGSFPMSWLFTSGGQSIGDSASASVLPMNIQRWFPLGLTSLISLLSKGLSRVFQHHSSKASILWHSAFFIVQLSHVFLTLTY